MSDISVYIYCFGDYWLLCLAVSLAFVLTYQEPPPIRDRPYAVLVVSFLYSVCEVVDHDVDDVNIDDDGDDVLADLGVLVCLVVAVCVCVWCMVDVEGRQIR